jgi:hypothetical protein
MALPVPNRGFTDTNLLRNLLLEQSQVMSPLPNIIAYRLEFFGIFRRLGFWSFECQVTKMP